METKTEINIDIDGRHYKVQSAELNGAQLKQLAGIPAANLLFLEVHGPGDDEQIQDGTVVELHSGEKFYDMPPGNFGLE